MKASYHLSTKGKASLSVFDLNDEEIHGGTGELCSEKMRVNSLDEEMMPDGDPMQNLVLRSDPKNDDVLYMERVVGRNGGDTYIVICDVCIRKFSGLLLPTRCPMVADTGS